jgi:hypothetical protein
LRVANGCFVALRFVGLVGSLSGVRCVRVT